MTADVDVREIIRAATGRDATDAEIARALSLAAAIDVPPRDPMFAAVVAMDAIHGSVSRRVAEIDEHFAAAAVKIVEAGVRRSGGRWVAAASILGALALTGWWWVSHDGLATYGLARAGSIHSLAYCSNPGWAIEGDFCYPFRDQASGKQWGWRIR